MSHRFWREGGQTGGTHVADKNSKKVYRSRVNKKKKLGSTVLLVNYKCMLD